MTARVNLLLAGLGYERRKRGASPRTYYYLRTTTPDVPAAQRPTSPSPTFFANLAQAQGA